MSAAAGVGLYLNTNRPKEGRTQDSVWLTTFGVSLLFTSRFHLALPACPSSSPLSHLSTRRFFHSKWHEDCACDYDRPFFLTSRTTGGNDCPGDYDYCKQRGDALAHLRLRGEASKHREAVYALADLRLRGEPSKHREAAYALADLKLRGEELGQDPRPPAARRAANRR